jgi:hypothetical protein
MYRMYLTLLPALPPNLGVNLSCMIEWPCSFGEARGNELILPPPLLQEINRLWR